MFQIISPARPKKKYARVELNILALVLLNAMVKGGQQNRPAERLYDT
ncbi:hypothetical protein PROFUN_05057 [Planoprotostelium fungivorum]|uniref:Uncharacterized protein n=1 Tax=Planoprotostelium fungivorum TaxID=1890364 RepID=A0A2P6NSD2_9EUKA|nr:hypothetical protein PROFUN_05057 [Planoprotostelium fungivorum]